MNKRDRIILAAVAFAMVAGLIGAILLFRLANPPDPVYGGHRLSFWLAPPSFTLTSSPGLEPLYTGLDSNAVPYLVHALKTRDGVVHRAYNRLWPHFPGWLKDRVLAPPLSVRPLEFEPAPGVTAIMPLPVRGPRSSAGVRANSRIYLARLGAEARPAMPGLIRLLRVDDDSRVRLSAAWALGNIADRRDQPAIEALAAAAKNDKVPFLKAMASQALTQIDPETAAKAGVTFGAGLRR